jgi:hypothetical protein
MAIGTLTIAWLLMTPAAVPADVKYINSPSFKIPITIDAARRAEMKELKLVVSDDKGQTWKQEATALPDQAGSGFPYFAKADGLYYFTVVVVDNQDKSQPPDPQMVPPSLKIVVDTAKPIVKITSAERQGDEILVSWDIQEENPDLNSLKLEYRPVDAPEMTPWYTAPLNPELKGQARFRLSQPGAVALRMQLQDLAGNQSLPTMKEVPAGSPATTNVATNTAAYGSPPPSPTFANTPSNPPQVTRAPVPGYPTEDRPMNGRPDAWSGAPPQAFPPAPANNYPPASPVVSTARVVAQAGPSQELPPSNITPVGATFPTGSMPPLLVTNKKSFDLDYDVTKNVPSKVGSVELWVTENNGVNWRLLSEEHDSAKQSVHVELAHEGIYGFRLVLRSGAGLSKGPPQPNDPPEMRIELDTTPPVAQLLQPKLDPQQTDSVVLEWNASDRNLSQNPITLQWSEQRSGPWNPIGEPTMPNASRHNWKLPKELPARVYMRLIVRDQAGNVSEATTPEPITVDLNKPEGILKGISPMVRQP